MRWTNTDDEGKNEKKRETRPKSILLLLGSLLRGLGDFATLAIGLLDTLDDTDSDRLPHVTDSEASKRRVFGVSLDAHGLAWDKFDHSGITGLDGLGILLSDGTSSTIDLGLDLSELAGNVGGVAIQDRRVAITDLPGVVEDNDLGQEGGGLLGGVVLRVGGDVPTTNILDRNVLDVETDVITRVTLLELLVVHLDGLDFGGHVRRGEVDQHAGLDDTSLDTANRNCANTTDLVDVLEGKAEGLVGGTLWGFDGVDGIEESLALANTGLGLLGPALVPWHVGRVFQHVVTVPPGNGHEGNGLGVVTDLLDETRGFLDDFVEPLLRPLGGVHLVDSDDELAHTEGEGKESMLAGLTIFGDTSFEFTGTGRNDEDSAIGLRGAGNHVLDEITVSRSVDDSNHVAGGFELPQGDIDGNTTLTLSLQLVEHPCVFEGSLAEFSSFLLELLNCSLVDTTALVDQVTGSGGFAGIDMSDDDDVYVKLLLSHF